MLHDRILVESPSDAERRTRSGIVIPATVSVSRRLSWATTVATGASVRHVKVGDTILFDPQDRSEVEVNGALYILLRERDVHAVHEDDSTTTATGLYL